MAQKILIRNPLLSPVTVGLYASAALLGARLPEGELPQPVGPRINVADYGADLQDNGPVEDNTVPPYQAPPPPSNPGDPAPIRQPLAVHPHNPRYFFDGRRGVYLGGHQIFVDLQDNSFNKEWTKDLGRPDDPQGQARLLDWARYLDFLERHRFNYVRNWIIWSTGSGTAAPPHKIASPMPFRRTGPGTAHDGGLKFDLHQFDEAFFQRLHGRARDLQERGIYLSVMLFELYGFLDGEAVDGQRLWEGNLFHGANNVNGLDIDRNRNRLGEEFFSLDDPEVVAIQKAYIEKMVNTLNDLDNVIWEVCNEPPAASLEWQSEMLRHLKEYEAGKPKQHLVLLSPGGWTPGGWAWPEEERFLALPADCFATANGWIDRENPKVYALGKPVILDLDHVAPGKNKPALIWKSFTRGYHFNLYDHPFEQPQHESRAWQVARENLRLVHRLVDRVQDIALLTPREDLSSTGYCLANEGREYIVYAEGPGEFSVQGLQAGRDYEYEWIDTAEARVRETGRITAESATQRLTPPGEGGVLFLMLRDNP